MNINVLEMRIVDHPLHRWAFQRIEIMGSALQVEGCRRLLIHHEDDPTLNEDEDRHAQETPDDVLIIPLPIHNGYTFAVNQVKVPDDAHPDTW